MPRSTIMRVDKEFKYIIDSLSNDEKFTKKLARELGKKRVTKTDITKWLAKELRKSFGRRRVDDVLDELLNKRWL